MLRLILIRHGQTDANANHLLQGQSDGRLNTIGWQETERLGNALKHAGLDVIISSDMVRAQDTASAIASHHGLPVITTPLVREWNCGEWDGRPAEEFIEIVRNLTIPLSQLRPPGGETLMEVQKRALTFIKDITEKYPGKTVALCSHGDFLRMVISILLKKTIEEADTIYRMENASYSVFEQDNGTWKMISFNQIPPQED
jgi:probable phosphoglycerate mutase